MRTLVSCKAKSRCAVSWTVETSCSRNFWAMSGISVVVLLVVAVAIVNSLRGLEGARRRRHSCNISTDCLVCQALGDSVLHVRQLHVQAAVDAPDLAGDVRGRVRGQEVDHACDLVGTAQPADRNLRPDLVQHLLR